MHGWCIYPQRDYMHGWALASLCFVDALSRQDRAGEPIGKGGARPGDEAETNGVDTRHVPTTNWYEKCTVRPLKVGGRFAGRSSVYESDFAHSCSSELAVARELARTTPTLACSEGQDDR